MSTFVLCLVGIVVLSGIFILRDTINNNQRKEINDKLKDSISFYRGTLTVKKREPGMAMLLGIEAYRRTKFDERPEKLIYTGATVGGVTTGGFHKTGGFTASDGGKTGKVKLYYYHQSGTKMIASEVKNIRLSEELAKEAQKSKIKQYIDGTNIVIVKDTSNSDEVSAASLLMQIGHKDAAYNMVVDAHIAAASTFEKCNDIIQWLSMNGSGTAANSQNVSKTKETKTMRASERKACETKKKKQIIIGAIVGVVVLALLGVYAGITTKNKKLAALEYEYNVAVELAEDGSYEAAINKFRELGDYKDSAQKMQVVIGESEEVARIEQELEEKYVKVTQLITDYEFAEALKILEELGDYKDSPFVLESCKLYAYDTACLYMDQGRYEESYELFQLLGDYEDSPGRIKELERKGYID